MLIWRSQAPFDQAVTNRTGTRLGPRALREASTLQPYDPPYGWGFDPLGEFAIVDYGMWPLITQRCEFPETLTPISNRSCPKMYQPSPWVGIITSRFPFLRPMPKSLAHLCLFCNLTPIPTRGPMMITTALIMEP